MKNIIHHSLTSKLRIRTLTGIGVALLSIAGCLIAISSQSTASSASGFNPGNIMSDQVMREKSSMTTAQIQQFLNKKGVNCTSGSNCLKNYTQNGKSAAQIIYEVSNEFNINPQVLIVLLQKEVGIVTMNNPESWRYRTAAGYGCPDSTPGVCNDRYFGFTNQLRWAATMFDAILRNSPTWYAPYVVGQNNILLHPYNDCGVQRVNIQNRATAALYSYTPYVPNKAALNAGYGTGDSCSSYGNRNFFMYFTDWFGSTQGTPFFRIGNKDAIYMLGANDTYYHIDSWATMRAYGWGEINNVITSYGDSYISGKTFAGKLNTLARFEGNEVYVIDKGLRRHAPSREILAHYGLSLGQESLLPESHLNHLRPASAIRNIAIGIENGAVYHMLDGEKHHFTGPDAYNSGNPQYSSLPRVDLTKEYLASITTGTPIYPPGTLIRVGDTAAVYMVSGYKEKAHVPSRDMASQFGVDIGKAVSVSKRVADSYKNKPSLVHFVIKEENNGIRAIVDGKKIYAVPNSLASSAVYNIQSSNLVVLNEQFLSRYSAHGSVSNIIRANGTAAIYKVEGGLKRHVTSWEALHKLSYSDKDVMNLSKSFVNSIPSGQPIK